MKKVAHYKKSDALQKTGTRNPKQEPVNSVHAVSGEISSATMLGLTPRLRQPIMFSILVLKLGEFIQLVK